MIRMEIVLALAVFAVTTTNSVQLALKEDTDATTIEQIEKTIMKIEAILADPGAWTYFYPGWGVDFCEPGRIIDILI